MTDLPSKSFISEDNISLIDFNKSFSFEQEININNSNSEFILNPHEKSFLKNKDINNEIFPDINNLFENDDENKTENSNNYINTKDFQQNLINFIPMEPLNQNIFFPKNEIKINNNNNLPFLFQVYQPNQLNPFIFNNSFYNNDIIPYFKKNINLLYNINNKNKIYKKNNKKKNVIKKSEEKKYPLTFFKTENIIKIELIESGEEKRTCVRLFPIPHKYSPYDMIRLIDKYLKTIPGKRIYRSIYVPLIKVIGKNIGYCFVDLVSPKYVIEFYNVFNGLLLKKCKKPCTVIFSDKQNSNNINENPLREPIFFKDTIKSE